MVKFGGSSVNAGTMYAGHYRPIYFLLIFVQGLPQPVYNRTSNWFANPPLPMNAEWSKATMTEQYALNNANYAAHGLPLYKNGALKAGEHRQQSLFDYTEDWKPGDKVPEVCTNLMNVRCCSADEKNA